MSIVKEKEETIREGLAKMRKDIEGLKKKEPSQRERSLRSIEERIEDFQGLLESFEFERLELETVNRNLAAPYRAMGAQFEKEYQEIKKLFEKAKNPDFYVEEKEEITNPYTTDQLIAKGNKVQQAGLDSLNKALKLVGATHVIADSIMEEQERQVQQLQKALINVKDTKKDIKTANEYIKYFAHELLKDKLWRILMILLIVILTAIIFLQYVYNPRAEDANKNKPPHIDILHPDVF